MKENFALNGAISRKLTFSGDDCAGEDINCEGKRQLSVGEHVLI